MQLRKSASKFVCSVLLSQSCTRTAENVSVSESSLLPTGTDVVHSVNACAYIIHQFLMAGLFTGMLITVLHPERMGTDVFLYLLSVHSACILSLSSECLFCPFKISRVYLLQIAF